VRRARSRQFTGRQVQLSHLRDFRPSGSLAGPRARSSSAPATSDSRRPKPSPPAASASPRSNSCPRPCPLSLRLGALVHDEFTHQDVDVVNRATVTLISRTANELSVEGTTSTSPMLWEVDLLLIVAGVRPDTALLTAAGAQDPGAPEAVVVDGTMATSLPHVWAAGDCVITRLPPARRDLPALGHHRLQAGPGRRRQRCRRTRSVPRRSRHAGRQGVRPGGAAPGFATMKPYPSGTTRSSSSAVPTTTRSTAWPLSRSQPASRATPLPAIRSVLSSSRLGTEAAKRVHTDATASAGVSTQRAGSMVRSHR